ncbi:hypothetical protein [Lampropedia cohaerens]|uniref:hypothetical protein n=1 Tax=Lampropedia cohaerens TaxID=1610491 RepID=UPI0012E371A9|nr:hypothetical protein [Lampropedia cohaerens]
MKTILQYEIKIHFTKDVLQRNTAPISERWKGFHDTASNVRSSLRQGQRGCAHEKARSVSGLARR